MTRTGTGRSNEKNRTAIVRLDTTVPGNVGSITPIVERILAVAASIGCADGQEFEIETAIREALANAIVHGCGEDPEKQVQVTVACTKDRSMIIVVSDPGNGFDAGEIPSPVDGENLLSDHGRGIFLINTLMDEVRIERGGSRIWMRKGPA